MARSTTSRVPYSQRELHDRRIRIFGADAVHEISMPMGGIGTGCIGLGGRGDLRNWEIFNAPNHGFAPPYTVPMLFCRAGDATVARVLEKRLPPPYATAHGLPPERLAGLPRLADATFLGEYPFGQVTFLDDALPVEVVLEGFNPMIPGRAEDSGLPVAILRYRVSNRTNQRVSGTIAWSLQNCVGLAAKRERAGDQPHGLGANVNTLRRLPGGGAGLFMTSGKYRPEHLGFGTMALLTDAADVTAATGWLERGWWDRAQRIWDDFAADGRLDGPTDDTPLSDDGRSHVGTLGACFDLADGEQTTLTFVFAWHFPWRLAPSMLPGQQREPVRNHYAGRFADAWDAGTHVLERLDALEEATGAFHRALVESTVPGVVYESVSTQMAILKTNTVMWLDSPEGEPGGRIFAYEGCSDTEGCCPMNCTHVWNYEQTLAHLYPSLERTMRRTDYADDMHDAGAMSFRCVLPLGRALPVWNPQTPAADGQYGTVVKLYRDWQLSGDEALLRGLYPAVRESLDFAQGGFAGWDADGDGVLEGVQHNTYDIDFYGPNTMTGALYLAALKAGVRMARATGDDASADRWERLAEQGAAKYDRMLFNGRYYVQDVRTPTQDRPVMHDGFIRAGEHPKYQYGQGCLSDQLLGQWAAHVAGLGYVLPEEHVRRAIAGVFEHNFRADLLQHASVQRTYALNDEAGLLLCTWPLGQREAFPFPYSDEVWTGIEYQVAAHLIYEGLVDEGLAIVHAIRQRHDGHRRNPFDEPECGHYYARALASWSVLLALSGQRYSAVERSLRVAPALFEGDFRCFLTLGEAWGSFRYRIRGQRLTLEVDVLAGEPWLQRLEFPWLGSDGPPAEVATSLAVAGRRTPAQFQRDGRLWTVVLDEPVQLAAGRGLRLRLSGPTKTGRR